MRAFWLHSVRDEGRLFSSLDERKRKTEREREREREREEKTKGGVKN